MSVCILSLIVEAAKQLVHELNYRFPAHHLMEALGLIYPQYWVTEDCKENFDKHMLVIKSQYCQSRATHMQKSRLAKKCRKGQVNDGVATVNFVDNTAIDVTPGQVCFLATFFSSNLCQFIIVGAMLLYGIYGLIWIHVFVPVHW
jgi:hypothetical protein